MHKRNKKGQFDQKITKEQWNKIKKMVKNEEDINKILSLLVYWGYSTVHGYRLLEKAALEIGQEEHESN